MKSNKMVVPGIVAVVMFPCLLWGFGGLSWLGYGPSNWHGSWTTGVVADKVVKGNSYRVMFRPDGGDKVEVLTCEDSSYFMNWDSGDDFANLQKEGHYQLKLTGYRNPMLSHHRNIVDYRPIK